MKEVEQVRQSAAYRFGMIGLPAGIAMLLACIFVVNRVIHVGQLTDLVCWFALVVFLLVRALLPRINRLWQLETLTFGYLIVTMVATFTAVVEMESATPLASLITISLWAALVLRWELSWAVLVAFEFVGTWMLLRKNIPDQPDLHLQFLAISVPVAWLLRRMVHRSYAELLTLRNRERELVEQKQAAYQKLKEESESRLEAEREHRVTESQLSEARRRESLGTLAGGVAHDFNNYLQAISNIAASAKLSTNDQVVERSLVQIQELAHNASSVCSQMLTVAGESPTRHDVVDLKHLIDDTVHLLRATLPTNCVVETQHLSSEPMFVCVDEPQVQLTLVNLMRNAGESMQPQGGSISVHSAVSTQLPHQTEDAAIFWLGERPHASSACILVSDRGHGMDPATLERIFDPYFTTKPTGHGFGLATTAGIIKSHHGAIRVVSKVGQGTEIALYLPLTDARPKRTRRTRVNEVPTPLESTALSQAGSHIREQSESQDKGQLLLIEDEPHVRRATTELLRRLGWTVVSAENGTQGLELARLADGPFKVVIVDYSMPDMNGLEVIEVLRQQLSKDTRMVLASGLTPPGLSSSEDSGPNVILRKPFRLDELVAAIECPTPNWQP